MSDDKSFVPTVQLKEYKGAYMWEFAEIEDFPSFKCRDDDVWVCSFPRSGTTFTQQMVYLIMTLDFEKATTVDLDDRFPYADFYDNRFKFTRGLKYLDSLSTSAPRPIKSHMHHFLLPDELRQGKGRIIYVARNPKAVIISLYKFLTMTNQIHGYSLREYVELFLTQKNVLHCPWGRHVREYWERRNDPNVLFLQYEKVVKDHRGTIKMIAEFLDRDLTDDQIEQVMDYTSLESMKSNVTCNQQHVVEKYKTHEESGAFINKGEVSGWRKELPQDLIERMDELIKKELKDTDLVFE